MVDRAATSAPAASLQSLVHCPFCQSVLANDQRLAGQLARCPTCRNHFRMPGGQQVPVAQVVTTELGNVNPAQIGQPQPAASAPTAVLTPAVLTPAPVTPAVVSPAVAAPPAQLAASPTPSGAAAIPVPAAAAMPAPAPVMPTSPVLPSSPCVPHLSASAPASAPAMPRAGATFRPLGFVKDEVPAPGTVPSVWLPVISIPGASVPVYSAPQIAGLAAGPAPIDPRTVPLLGEGPPAPLGPFPAVVPSEAVVVAPGEVPPVEDREFEENPALVVARGAPAWVMSALVHAVALIMLGMYAVVTTPSLEPMLVELGFREKKGEQLDTMKFEAPLEEPEAAPVLTETPNPVSLEDPLSAPDLVIAPAPSDLSTMAAPTVGMAMAGRGEGARKKLVAQYGGNEESETAVGMGLAWLKEHQNPNGSWSFRHTQCPKCNGKCSHAGGSYPDTGSTGLALLPFLGAGQSHKEGKYQETVRRGLYYLAGKVRARTPDSQGGDLRGGTSGNMYCHGLAAIALCEAYGLTRDEGLKVPAQKAIDFTVFAQDQDGGGWRYRPREPGDTSAFGWQLMALKSGHMAYLKVPPKTIERAITFLDHVQEDEGAYYGYTGGGNGLATTSIGLLCRMYLGWKKDNPALMRGVQFLSDRGPSLRELPGKPGQFEPLDMYHNYYATQVLHHFGGEHWKKWNAVMRDKLVAAQAKKDTGHEEGSWSYPHHWSASGGRLYDTALSIMTLEVYYRHLPIYKDDSIDRDFK